MMTSCFELRLMLLKSLMNTPLYAFVFELMNVTVPSSIAPTSPAASPGLGRGFEPLAKTPSLSCALEYEKKSEHAAKRVRKNRILLKFHGRRVMPYPIGNEYIK